MERNERPIKQVVLYDHPDKIEKSVCIHQTHTEKSFTEVARRKHFPTLAWRTQTPKITIEILQSYSNSTSFNNINTCYISLNQVSERISFSSSVYLAYIHHIRNDSTTHIITRTDPPHYLNTPIICLARSAFIEQRRFYFGSQCGVRLFICFWSYNHCCFWRMSEGKEEPPVSLKLCPNAVLPVLTGRITPTE